MDNKSKTILVVAIIAIAVAIGAVLFMMSKLKQQTPIRNVQTAPAPVQMM